MLNGTNTNQGMKMNNDRIQYYASDFAALKSLLRSWYGRRAADIATHGKDKHLEALNDRLSAAVAAHGKASTQTAAAVLNCLEAS